MCTPITKHGLVPNIGVGHSSSKKNYRFFFKLKQCKCSSLYLGIVVFILKQMTFQVCRITIHTEKIEKINNLCDEHGWCHKCRYHVDNNTVASI